MDEGNTSNLRRELRGKELAWALGAVGILITIFIVLAVRPWIGLAMFVVAFAIGYIAFERDMARWSPEKRDAFFANMRAQQQSPLGRIARVLMWAALIFVVFSVGRRLFLAAGAA